MTDLPDWVNRPAMPPQCDCDLSRLRQLDHPAGGWDIGLAPLADTAFNRCKSAIKTLDYAALGLAVVASDVAAYRGSLADGPGGMLAANRPDAWFAALSRLVRDAELRRGLARGAMDGVRRERHARAAGRGAACGMAGGGAADGRRRAGRLNARMDVSNVWMCQT